MTYFLAFLILPFLQIGISYYASGAVLLMFLMLFKWRDLIISGFLQHPIRTLLCALAFVMPMLYPAGIDSTDVQRALREVLILVLMVTAFGRVGEQLSDTRAKTLSTITCLMIGGYLVLVLIQLVLLPRQIYFGLPKGLFVINDATIPEALDLLYSKIRPTGTFGEPSYLGFILTSLAFGLMPLADKWLAPRLAIYCVALIALACQSLSFFIAIALIIGYARPGLKNIKVGALIPAFIGLLLMAVIFSDVLDSFITRLSTISDQSLEVSGYVRIFGPLSIIVDYLGLYPTGVPFYKLYFVLEEYVPEGIRPLSYHDNGLINFLFDFGIYGFLLLFFYFNSVKDNTSRLYLFACGIFNGALLAPDKLGVMIFALSLYHSFQMFAARSASESAPDSAAAARPERPQFAGARARSQFSRRHLPPAAR